jgi:hypothetical protein
MLCGFAGPTDPDDEAWPPGWVPLSQCFNPIPPRIRIISAPPISSANCQGAKASRRQAGAAPAPSGSGEATQVRGSNETSSHPLCNHSPFRAPTMAPATAHPDS